MKNIFLIRPRGFNIGNDVIFLGVSHFLRMAFPTPYNVISLPATGKYETQRKAGLTAQTVYEINQYGHGVVIGGGNLYENNELEIDPIAIRALERPLMLFSISRGRIYNRDLELVDRTDTMPDAKLQLVHQHAAVSLSRDRATKEYLDSLGCRNVLGGCPTLFMNEIPQHLVPLLEAEKTDCLVSVRTPTLMSIPTERQYMFREQLVELLSVLRRYGYNIIKLLCHDHRDIPFAASFRNVEYVYSEDVFTYLTYLRNTRLNVTFRLHSFIPCLAYDVPSIKISYDQRALSMLDTLGLGSWNIDLLRHEVVAEVEHRLRNLGDLESEKHGRRRDAWVTLRANLLDGARQFAEMATR